MTRVNIAPVSYRAFGVNWWAWEYYADAEIVPLGDGQYKIKGTSALMRRRSRWWRFFGYHLVRPFFWFRGYR